MVSTKFEWLPVASKKTHSKKNKAYYEFMVVPMGLHNSPGTFQSFRNAVFYDCINDYLVVYIDDFLILSGNKQDYIRHLRIVLSQLRKHTLLVGDQKNELLRAETKLLGLLVERHGVQAMEDCQKIMRDWPNPLHVSDSHSFIGLL